MIAGWAPSGPRDRGGGTAMMTIRQLLARKGHGIRHIDPDASVLEALQVMAEYDVGALVVLRDGELVGIVSERDYARKVILKGRPSKDTRVVEIMNDKPICVASTDSVEACMGLMTDKRTRHLPVVENGQVAGIISIGDVVKAIIEDREMTIEELQQYITGGR
jgi:CBS domain-containing protein